MLIYMEQERGPMDIIHAAVNQECLTGEIKCLPLLLAMNGIKAKLFSGEEINLTAEVSSLSLCDEGPLKKKVGACGGLSVCRHPAVKHIEDSTEQAVALNKIIVE